MSTPFEKKILEFTKRMETEDNSKVSNEVITYLQGVLDNERDPIRREQIAGLVISVTLMKGLVVVANEVGKQKDKMDSEINNHLARIIKLEKRFDELDAGK